MELLEGQTLRDVLGGVDASRLPLRKSIDYATQIAAALAVAHAKRLTPRVFKPEHLFITNDGRVKMTAEGQAFRGLFVYSFDSGHYQKVWDRGHSAQWLPDGKHITLFDLDTISFLDLDIRRIVTAALPRVPGVDGLSPTAWPRLSRDGSTLFICGVQEQGDIWLMRPGKVSQ